MPVLPFITSSTSATWGTTGQQTTWATRRWAAWPRWAAWTTWTAPVGWWAFFLIVFLRLLWLLCRLRKYLIADPSTLGSWCHEAGWCHWRHLSRLPTRYRGWWNDLFWLFNWHWGRCDDYWSGRSFQGAGPFPFLPFTFLDLFFLLSSFCKWSTNWSCYPLQGRIPTNVR